MKQFLLIILVLGWFQSNAQELPEAISETILETTQDNTKGLVSDGVRSFSLDEAVDFAIENSYKAINARREVAKAIKKKWEVTSSGLPQINAEVGYQNFLKQPVSLLPAAAFDPFSQIRNLDQFYDVTTTGAPDQIPQAPGADDFIPVVFGTKQSLSATATLTQLIFDGSYLVGLQAAKSFLRYSKNFEEKTNLEVRKGVINAYGGVLLSRESVTILEKNIVTLKENLKETVEIYKNGLTEEENVEQLQLTLLQLQTQLSNAKRLEGIAKQLFNLALGLDVQEKVVFKDQLDTLAQSAIDLAISNQELKVENNIDYKIAYNFTEQRDLELKLEKSKALPSLGAFVNYGTQGNSNSFTFFDSDQLWFQSSILGASLKIPVFSSFGRNAKTKQAKIAAEQAQTQLQEAIETIKLQTDTAKSDYLFAVENYENTKKNLALAERIEQKNQIKFKEGLSTSFELRQAQTQLYSIQQELLQSMLSIVKSKAELETVLNLPLK